MCYQGLTLYPAAWPSVGTAKRKDSPDQVVNVPAPSLEFMVVGFALNFVIGTLAYFLLVS